MICLTLWKSYLIIFQKLKKSPKKVNVSSMKKISVYVVAYNIKHDPSRSYFLSLVSKVLNKEYVKVVKRHPTLGLIVPLARYASKT